jgi:hypothetical protein
MIIQRLRHETNSLASSWLSHAIDGSSHEYEHNGQFNGRHPSDFTYYTYNALVFISTQMGYSLQNDGLIGAIDRRFCRNQGGVPARSATRAHRIKIASHACRDLFRIAPFVGVAWLLLPSAAQARAIFMASPAPGGLNLFPGALSRGGHVREIGAKTPRRGTDALSG